MVQIRRAERPDLPKILHLLSEDSLSDPPEDGVETEEHLRAFEIISRRPDHELIVATLDRDVVATVQISYLPGLSFRGASRAQVEGVRVRSDMRNRQIGRALMEFVIARAKARNCRIVQLTTNRARADAQRFYAGLGFKPSHVGMKLCLL